MKVKNLIIYMTEQWKESYKGHLEMWSHDKEKNEPRQCVKKILPKYNRLIIFDASKWHSVKEITKGTRYAIAINLWDKQPQALK